MQHTFNKTTTYSLLHHHKDKDISSRNHFEVFSLKMKFLFAFGFFKEPVISLNKE